MHTLHTVLYTFSQGTAWQGEFVFELDSRVIIEEEVGYYAL